MLRTSSGVLAAEEAGRGAPAGSVVAVVAAARAATIPGARLARGTLRGRPALVVWTEAAWSFGAAAAASAAGAPAAAGAGSWAAGAPPARTRSARTRSPPVRSARRLDRPGVGGAGAVG